LIQNWSEGCKIGVRFGQIGGQFFSCGFFRLLNGGGFHVVVKKETYFWAERGHETRV